MSFPLDSSKTKWITSRDFAPWNPQPVLQQNQQGMAQKLPEALKYYRMRFRKVWTIPAPSRAKIRITADDYYKLRINGRFVGQGPAQGYPFCYYWNEFDITPFLRPGENCIEADVFYQGMLNRAYNSADRRMGMMAEILAEGLPVLQTDETWQCARVTSFSPGHGMGYDTMCAEVVDDRIPMEAFLPCTVAEPDYRFSPEPCKALQVYPLEPKQIRREKGILWCDFGSLVTGTLEISAKGPAGSVVTVYSGEEAADSRLGVRWQMRCNCDCRDSWTLAGGAGHFAQYEYRSFRYAAVETDENTEILSLRAIVRHYPFDPDFCNLETDNAQLKKIWELCKNTVRYGCQEVYVDCPTREKGQYAGDMTISSASQVILTGDLSLLKKGIDNQIQSLQFCPGILTVTPGSFWQEIADYSLQFPILALRYYAYTGDRAYLKTCLEACRKVLKFYGRYARADGLLDQVTEQTNMVDWPQTFLDGYEFNLNNGEKVGCHCVLNAFYIGCMKQTEEIQDILGIPNSHQSRALTDVFNRVFFREESGRYADCEGSRHSAIHSSIFPLFYGLCPENQQRRVCDFLVRQGMRCNVYVSYFLLKALCRCGCYQQALDLILSPGENSWSNMLREGATTCFEAWGKDKKPNTSLCHPWATAPIPVLVEDILPNLPQVGRLCRKI